MHNESIKYVDADNKIKQLTSRNEKKNANTDTAFDCAMFRKRCRW